MMSEKICVKTQSCSAVGLSDDTIIFTFLLFSPFFGICSKGKINDNSLNIFVDFGVLQVRHVYVSPIVMAKL